MRLGGLTDFQDVDANDAAALIRYLDEISRTFAREKETTYRAQQLRTGMAVLDVGCGIGDDVRAIAKLVNDGGRVVGVDASTAMIEEARARGVPGNAEFIVGRSDALPFPAASFDACRAERVFQHLCDAHATARELRRILRPGGSALVIDPDWETVMISGDMPLVVRRIVRAFTAHLTNPHAGRNALAVLRRAGFEAGTSRPIVSTPTLRQARWLFLDAAIRYAIDQTAVSWPQAEQWLTSLAEAERRGEFFCAVIGVATLAIA
jgi:SAM-dependent methyltransferase